VVNNNAPMSAPALAVLNLDRPPVADPAVDASGPQNECTQFQSAAKNAPGEVSAYRAPAVQAELAFGGKVTPKSDDLATPAVAPTAFTPLTASVLAGATGGKRDAQDSASDRQPEPDAAPVRSITAPVRVEVFGEAPAFATSHMKAAGSSPAPHEPEPVHIALPASTGGTHVREITVRIAAPGSLPVDVQLKQSEGEVRVMVRTSDGVMQSSLRQDLPQLVNALDRAGFHAEIFTTHGGGDAPMTMATASGRDGGANDASGTDSSSSSHGGSGKDSSFSGAPEQRQQQQRQREKAQLDWLHQMEN